MPTGAGELVSSTQAHKQGINAVSCLPSSQGALALSAGKDHSIRLWAAPALKATSSGAVQPPTCLAVYKGHTDAVEDVAASPSGSAFCSGAWDGNVHIWRTGTHTVHAMATSGACVKQHVSLSAWPQLMSTAPEHYCEHHRNASPFYEYVGCILPP